MTSKEKALKIIELIGGEKNVKTFMHCATRLRFNLVNDGKADLKAIKELEGIMGAQFQGGQTQIIIGGEVAKVYRETVKAFPSLSSEQDNQTDGKKETIFNRLLNTLSSILVASLAPIIGGGMLKGLLFMMTTTNIIDPAGGTAMILTITSDCMFYFFPFLLAVSAAKQFKTNEYMAVALAGALMYPSLIQAATENTGAIKFLNFIPIIPKNYGSSVLPIILAVWVLSYVYKYIQDRMPNMLTIIFTPLLTLLLMVPFMLFCLAPIGFYLGEYVAKGLDALIGFAPWLAGFVIAATRPFLVLTGMHHAIRPLSIQQISTYGYSSIGAMNFMSTMAQATAPLAIWFVTKDKKMKQVAASTTISGYLGITEPALYGVLVNYKSAMAGAFLGGGIGGLLGSVLGARAFASAMPSILSIPVYIGEGSTIGFAVGLLATIVSTFVITIILYKTVFRTDELKDQGNHGKSADSGTRGLAQSFQLFSPADGDIIPMRDVKDETFASEILGKGIAIEPLNGKIFAPADGIVKTIFKTKHAIGMVTADGVEVLLHAGLNTVNLEGKYFTAYCKDEQEVKKGDLLLTFDLEALKKEGYDPSLIMIISNSNEYLSILTEFDSGSIFVGEKVLTAIK